MASYFNFLACILCNTMILIVTVQTASLKNNGYITITMPNVSPKKDDHYICHSVKLSNQKSIYAVSFSPIGKLGRAHHMLLHLCDKPGSKSTSWDCGEMSSGDENDNSQSSCHGSGQQLIYSQAMDAPGLVLEKDVSFKLGGENRSNHLILQVHYKYTEEFKKNKNLTDDSGIKISYITDPTSKLAGVHTLATLGIIPPRSTVYQEAACKYTGRSPLYPFAYRIHTHSLGQLVVGYRVRNNTWLEIGRFSPQQPQMYHKITHKAAESVIRTGDYIAARCIMTNSNTEKTVKIGSRRSDEMCNFYIIYWVDAKNQSKPYRPAIEICIGPGYPSHQWQNEGLDLTMLPEEADQIPGTKEHIKETIILDDPADY